MIIAYDIDGIYADFNEGYYHLMVGLTGKNLFPKWPFVIPTWNWPEHYGYTKEEVSNAWDRIAESDDFWLRLKPYDGVASYVKRAQAEAYEYGHEVYYITSRIGKQVKAQTELWLQQVCEVDAPTVLISSQKGECCHALKVDWYIDDKNENVADVIVKSPKTNVALFKQPWNSVSAIDLLLPQASDLTIVNNLDEFGDKLYGK